MFALIFITQFLLISLGIRTSLRSDPNSESLSATSDFMNRFTDCSASVRDENNIDLKNLVRCFGLPILVTPNHKPILRQLCKEFDRYTPLATTSVAVAVGHYALRVTCEVATGGDYMSNFTAAKASVTLKRPGTTSTFLNQFAQVAFCFFALIKPRKDIAEATQRACLEAMDSEDPIMYSGDSSAPELALLKDQLMKISEDRNNPVERRLNAVIEATTRKKRLQAKTKRRSPLSYSAIGAILVGSMVTFFFVGSMSIYAGQDL